MLTDIAIKKASPRDKPFRLADSGGLFVFVSPNGSKLWRLKYRRGGKEQTASFGAYPGVSLREAREKRDTFKASLANGGPAKEAPRSPSFETVAREYVERQAKRRVPRYRVDAIKRLEMNVFGALGARPIAEIEAPEILAVLRKIEERGAHEMAARIRALCSQAFRYGVACGHCKRDPAGDLRGALAPHVTRHHPAISPGELPELLKRIAAYDGDKVTRYALQFMALTFLRTSELIGATWAEFDIADSLWTVPGDRMKMKAAHVVPMARQTLALLEELRALNGDSPYVFASPFNAAKPISNNTILFALYRLGYRGRQTGHGFRSVATTILNEERERGAHAFSPDVIERQLDHVERNAIRAAYNRAEHLQARRAMMAWWADYLDDNIGRG